MRYPLLWCCLLFVFGATVDAKTNPTPSKKNTPKKATSPITIKPIDVKKKKRVETPEEKEPTGFATVIDLSKQHQRVRSLGESLRESAGVNARSTGGTGAWSALSIRGSSSSQVQILLDGIPLNHGGSGAINLSDLPLDTLKEAVIYRGFAPAHLGGAIGGVVNLITLFPQESSTFQANITAGSFGTLKTNLSWGGRQGQWEWFLLAHYIGTEGNFPYFDNHGTPLQTEDDLPDAVRQNNQNHLFSTLARAAYQPIKKLKLSLTYMLVGRNMGVPGVGNYRSEEASFGSTRHLLQLHVAGKHLPLAGLRWQSRVYFIQQQEVFKDLLGEIGLGRQDTNNHSLVAGWKSLIRWAPVAFWEGTLSFHARRESFQPKDELQPTLEQPERSRWSLQPTLQSLFYLWDERISIIASGQLEYLCTPALPVPIMPGFQPEEETMLLPIGRAGLRIQPWSFVLVQGNVGRYVRPPTFWELHGDRGITIGNPRLKPEVGLSMDAGGVLQFKKLGILREVRFGYAFFHTQSTDLIRFIQNSQQTAIAVNISEAHITGHELQARVNIADIWHLSADITWMEAINQSEIVAENGKQLPGRPLWEVSIRSDITLSWGRLFYSYTGLGGNYLDTANLQELAPRHIHNLGLTISPIKLARALGSTFPWHHLRLTLEVKNILDQRVAFVPLRPPLPNIKEIKQALSDYGGYPLPGRSFYISIQWKL